MNITFSQWQVISLIINPQLTKMNNVFFLFFSIDVIPEEGGTNIELISGGRNVEVTTANVYDYVRKYAEYRMVKSEEKALQV